MRLALGFLICVSVWSLAIYVNYRMALAGAPQQQWFYCHVLEVCGEQAR